MIPTSQLPEEDKLRLKLLDFMSTIPELNVTDDLVERCRLAARNPRSRHKSTFLNLTSGFAETVIKEHLSNMPLIEAKEIFYAYGWSFDDMTEVEREQTDPKSYLIRDLMSRLWPAELMKIALKFGPRWLITRQLNSTRPFTQQPEPYVQQASAYAPTATAAPVLVQPTAPPAPLCSELFQDYTEEKRRAGIWESSVADQHKGYLNALIEIIGDRSISEYTSEDARSYQQTLIKLPANRNKSFAGTAPLQLIKQGGYAPMSMVTFNKHVGSIEAFFNWCQIKDYIGKNYFHHLKIKGGKGRKSKDREQFTIEEIAQIFEPKDYLKEVKGKSFRYWGPLILLYSGLRANELCQIHLKDIEEKDGIWILKIDGEIESDRTLGEENSKTMKNHKRIKNGSSQRDVPVHPDLIKLGFHKFVEAQRRNANQIRLFPELTWSKGNRHARKLSHWFNAEYLHGKLKINKKKVLHSFRHGFAQTLRIQGIQDSVRFELLGHTHSVEQDTSYTVGSGTHKIVFEAISKVQFPVKIDQLKLDWGKPKTISKQIEVSIKQLS